MSDKPEYPARGEMSADGKFYTHTDGSVHERIEDDGVCDECSMRNDNLKKDRNSKNFISGCGSKMLLFSFCKWRVVASAYVPSDEECEACDMARAMVKQCCYYRACAKNAPRTNACESCSDRANNNCPARRYLAKHGAADAWAADMKGGETGC